MSSVRRLLQDAAAGPAVRADFRDVVRRGRRARRRRALVQATAAASVIILAVTTLGDADDDRLKTTPPADEPTAELESSTPQQRGVQQPHHPRAIQRSGDRQPASHAPTRSHVDVERAADTAQSPGSSYESAATEDRTILFIRGNQLYLMDEDGSDVEQLTQDQTVKQDASWSPDGSKVVLSGSKSGGLLGTSSSEIWVFDLSNRTWMRLAHADGLFGGPQWSPDGGSIVFWSGEAVMRMDADGSDLVELAPGSSPSWSPDGSRIAYTCASGLCTMAPDGSDRSAVPNSSNLDKARWSPGGRWIAAVDRVDKTVVVVRPDGSERLSIGTTPAGLNPPTWIDDAELVYELDDTKQCCLNEPGLYTARTDHWRQRRLTTHEDNAPAVRPRS
jgi:dipeptidyl aminopeptidase/acylaminoacyl peptidase